MPVFFCVGHEVGDLDGVGDCGQEAGHDDGRDELVGFDPGADFVVRVGLFGGYGFEQGDDEHGQGDQAGGG